MYKIIKSYMKSIIWGFCYYGNIMLARHYKFIVRVDETSGSYHYETLWLLEGILDQMPINYIETNRIRVTLTYNIKQILKGACASHALLVWGEISLFGVLQYP